MRYLVHLADDTETGRAKVTYTSSTGADVSQEVALPWRSEAMRVDPDSEAHVAASLLDDGGSGLVCEVQTNQGPYGRVASVGGDRSCDLLRPLAQLGRR